MDENSNLHVDRIEKSPQVTPLSLITLSFATVSPAVSLAVSPVDHCDPAQTRILME